jgi:hypothetical protein
VTLNVLSVKISQRSVHVDANVKDVMSSGQDWVESGVGKKSPDVAVMIV